MTRTTHAIHRPTRGLLALMLTGLLGACGHPEDATVDKPADPVEPQRCAASPVRCTEQSIDKLNLLTVVSKGEVREEGAVPGEFLTYVDTTAGGASPTQSYTYLRFTSKGLTQVAVDDQAALASADWDISFRRFIIRVNSGVAGPSCTAVARTPAGTAFDSVQAVDASWKFETENYLDNACAIVPDESGLGSPATRLAEFWEYKGCLSMTKYVYVVRLADGRHVKLQVMGYYDPAAQQVCEETGKGTSSAAGHIRVRWAFLP